MYVYYLIMVSLPFFRTLAVSAGLCLMASACSEQEASEHISTEDLVRPAKLVSALAVNAETVRAYPATLQAKEQAVLTFRVPGELQHLPARAGDSVKRGELLAALDPTDYQLAVKEREATFDLAQAQYKKNQRLAKQKFVSSNDLDVSRAEFRRAQAALDLARDDRQYTELKAPFDGVVARVEVDNFEAVKVGQAIVLLQDLSQLEVHFSIPESTLLKFRRLADRSQICGEVYLTPQSPPKKACYKSNNATPDPLTRSYPVVFQLQEQLSDSPTLPGMSVTLKMQFNPAWLTTSNTQQGVLVPVEALFKDQGETWVWRVDAEGMVHKTPVTLHSLQSQQALISQGLEAGQTVVAAGVHFLKPGQKVRPIRKERGL